MCSSDLETLTLTGGTLTVAGDIVQGSTTRTTGTPILNGGTLDMGRKNIGGNGSSTGNLTNITLSAGTLRNVLEINNGAALTKGTAGTLILDGTNSFSGALTISAGTLQVGAGGATGTPGSGNIVNGATLAFNRSGSVAVGNLISGEIGRAHV